MEIALAHDYVTQRGGAERVVLAMARAFPGSPLHTALYDPAGTFPEFAAIDVRTMPINRFGLLRRHHRLALPFLASAVSDHSVHADVLLTSSSGWAHGIPTTGRKVVYCHAPARWLYQTDRYAGDRSGVRGIVVKAASRALAPRLRAWDQRAADSADRYIVNSQVVKRMVAQVYGIEAEVLPPPPASFDRSTPAESVPGIDRPFVLCVARLLPYKNVDLVIEAAAEMSGLDVVIVGDGPERARLQALADRLGGAHLLGRVPDSQLRWLYENSEGLIAASFEDFGLSPLEAASFGKPSVALRDGGYLDTVADGVTGVFFDRVERDAIASALGALTSTQWDAGIIESHAESFSETRFAARLRTIVDEELRLA